MFWLHPLQISSGSHCARDVVRISLRLVSCICFRQIDRRPFASHSSGLALPMLLGSIGTVESMLDQTQGVLFLQTSDFMRRFLKWHEGLHAAYHCGKRQLRSGSRRVAVHLAS
mmetsp:Transcript_78375/g.203698  ORF Transcript_78375/g.203698 Transcript_78375/m.203698 type:complete len:113 (+) Transcript_78375:233-571(+)